ncbi:MAG: glycoside hydrolase family 15 protein [Patescibacteria group bacterium]
MARALTLGNGTFLVCLDEHGFVRDMYYPYVGLENHVAGEKHRIGIWANDTFSWIDDGTWNITIGYKSETMVGYLVCKSDRLKLTVVMEDIVYNETNVFVRQVDVYNHSDQEIKVRLFFHQVFWISESRKRNTAFYDPTHNAIVHYKGERVFIVNGMTDGGSSIDDFSIGAYKFEGKEGVFRDAEDGELTQNAVEHGSVDSVIRLSGSCAPNQKARFYYWISAGLNLTEAYTLNSMVLEKKPQSMIHSTEAYWRAWLETKQFPTDSLSPEIKKLFDTSLFILRCHTDNRGSIIASADSEMIEFGKDDYSYMWPRDAAFIVSVLSKAGYEEVTKPFFNFCRDVLHEDGYLHHRFRSDRSLGSTWHSTTSQHDWLKDKILQLPIQEDESASVLVALWEYYQASKDLEYIEVLYKPFIEKIANFLVSFRDPATGLPLPSYDLWEEKMGVSTYTCASVYGGLMAAARFSELLDKRNHMREYKDTAKSIKDAAIKHLYSEKLQSFIRTAHVQNGVVRQEEIVDSSSLYGLWHFKMFEQDHPLFQKTVKAVQQRLRNPAKIGGYIRYEHDEYFKSTDISNPWFITTMWEAQRRMAHPEATIADLQYVEQTLQWVYANRYQSGVLAEQLNPYTGQSLSATPLVWSHAVLIETVLIYLQTKKQLEKKEEVVADSLHEL